MSGRAKERQELAETPIPLEAALAAVPCRGAGTLVEDLFGAAWLRGRDRDRPGGGAPPTATCGCGRRRRSAELLNHVYVLLPVADHYWIGEAEVDKLLARRSLLEAHPRKDLIVRRYLGNGARSPPTPPRAWPSITDPRHDHPGPPARHVLSNPTIPHAVDMAGNPTDGPAPLGRPIS